MSLLSKSIIFIFAILFVACKNNTTPLNLFDATLDGEEVKVTTLNMDTIHIGMRIKLIAKDKLIISYNDNNYKYIIYQINNDNLIYLGHFLSRGNGPYEINIPEIKYDSYKDCLRVYAPYNSENKLFHIPFNNYSNLFTPSTWNKAALPHVPSRVDMEFINDSTFLMLSGNKEHKFFSLSYLGKDKYYKCLNLTYPKLNEEITSYKKSILFSGVLKKQPAGDSYLYSSESSKLSFIFNIINDSITNIKYLSNVIPNIKLDATGKDYTRDGDTEDGCIYLDVTESYIYIGYNNVTLEQIRNNMPFKDEYPCSFFDRINVFDWNGNFIKRLILDKPISNFVVTPDNDAIYANTFNFSGDNVTDEIVKINLKTASR